MPTPVPGVVSNAIDSAKGKEMQGHHLASQLCQIESFRINPSSTGSNLGRPEGHSSKRCEIEWLSDQGNERLLLLIFEQSRNILLLFSLQTL